jgi:HEAT repeats
MAPRLLTLLCGFALLCAAPAAHAQGKLSWTPDAKKAVVDAAEQKRVLFLSIGFVGEERSEAIRKSAFSNKAVIAQAAETINIPAWTWALGEEKKLPAFGEAEPFDHSANLAQATSEWLTPNSLDTIAVPQHVWMTADGEILVSCPWEISAEEMSWCFDEALRRAGMESRPAMDAGAHPPRRLLLGLVHEISDDDDLGRGLSSKELKPIMEEMRKGFVSGRNTEDLIRIMFSKDKDGVEFMEQQLGVWDFGSGAMAAITDGSYGLVGMISPVEYLDLLKTKTEAPRDSLRATVAVAYEQMGRPEGLSAVKKALKKEKSDFVRAEWVRALGACARGNKSTAKALIKIAEKDKDPRVQLNAVIALGHVLPQAEALEFLLELAKKPGSEIRQAAVLALALGREYSARADLVKLRNASPSEALLTAVDKAVAVLDGANLFELEDAIRAIDGSELARPRLFFRAKMEMPDRFGGGEGRGEGRGPGGGPPGGRGGGN